LDQVEAVEEWLRLDEVDKEAPCKIGSHEETEGAAFVMPAGVESVKCEGEEDQEQEFVKLRGVAWYAIAEVNSPRECSRGATGVVGETGEEAADAADGDADAEWHGEEVAGAGANVGEALDDFDGQPAAQQATDDGLAAAGEGKELLNTKTVDGGVFEHAEDAAAEESADGGSGDDPPAAVVGDNVAALRALVTIQRVAASITQSFKQRVKGWLGQYSHGFAWDDASIGAALWRKEARFQHGLGAVFLSGHVLACCCP